VHTGKNTFLLDMQCSDSKAKKERAANANTKNVWGKRTENVCYRQCMETLLQRMYGKRYYREVMGNAITENVWESRDTCQ